MLMMMMKYKEVGYLGFKVVKTVWERGRNLLLWVAVSCRCLDSVVGGMGEYECHQLLMSFLVLSGVS